MVKLALNFICKNESHIIEKMLYSTKPIVDLIVATDTGSSDGTQDIIKKFGKDNNIPTYVFDRPFDNFENSRNHSMQKLIETSKLLKWDLDKSYGFWIDCDETLIIADSFDKEHLTEDIYMLDAYIDRVKHTKNTFFKLSKDFEWYGPVHEFIIPKYDKCRLGGVIDNLYVDCKLEGASWKGSISDKYRSHASILENYIDNDRTDPRWIFYTAQSYYDSASTESKSDNDERLRRSMHYYKERVERKDGFKEEIFFSQFRIGTIMKRLEEPWYLTHQELLKAYSLDPLRGESIKAIIDYYLQMGDWEKAYIYTKFGKSNFHGKNPYPNRVLFIDESLYGWKFIEVNAIASYYTGRMDEAKSDFKTLKSLILSNPSLFSKDDISKINHNIKIFNK
jgi:hypothetical protein